MEKNAPKCRILTIYAAGGRIVSRFKITEEQFLALKAEQEEKNRKAMEKIAKGELKAH